MTIAYEPQLQSADLDGKSIFFGAYSTGQTEIRKQEIPWRIQHNSFPNLYKNEKQTIQLQEKQIGDNKVVLVTGCAKGGIGYEYCKAFAEQNCHVFASDISQRMHDMLDLSSDNIETPELDVASDESVATVVNNMISKCGRIDILINNAGTWKYRPFS